jgi:hypothetical protein
MTSKLPSGETPQGGTSAPANTSEFAATKRIGFILDVGDNGSLYWHEADKVLDKLENEQHELICAKHLDTVQQHNSNFRNVKVLPGAEEAHEKFVSNDFNGHLYRSRTISADFAPDAVNPNDIAFSLSLVLAYTVCVQIPADEDGTPRQLHSKFWYNAIAVPATSDVDAHVLLDNLKSLSSEIDKLGQAVLDATIERYSKAVNDVKTMTFAGATKNCRQISDVCIEFRDEDFNDQAKRIENDGVLLKDATGESLNFLRTVIRDAISSRGKELLFSTRDEGITADVMMQRDNKEAKALYVVTNSGDIAETGNASPAKQMAFGVTSYFQPRRFVAASDRAQQKVLHGRAANSISVARVSIEAGAL